MARLARMKFDRTVGWYHLYASVAAVKGHYPLADEAVRLKLIGVLKWYARVYCCEVASFTVMGNHYHVVARFDSPRKPDRKELYARALLFYPRSQKMLDAWPESRWERFEARIFDVSEFMRNIQAAFATWYNRNYSRKGRFWADRFKSTLLTTPASVLECILYVELNAVRAGLTKRPEDYAGSSLYLREIDKDRWLLPLSEFYAEGGNRRYENFKELIYHRGAIMTKAGQQVLSQEIVERERLRGFARSGVYRKKLRYFTDGLVLGGEIMLREKLVSLRDAGQYLRRQNPVELEHGGLFALREQRKNFIQT